MVIDLEVVSFGSKKNSNFYIKNITDIFGGSADK